MFHSRPLERGGGCLELLQFLLCYNSYWCYFYPNHPGGFIERFSSLTSVHNSKSHSCWFIFVTGHQHWFISTCMHESLKRVLLGNFVLLISEKGRRSWIHTKKNIPRSRGWRRGQSTQTVGRSWDRGSEIFREDQFYQAVENQDGAKRACRRSRASGLPAVGGYKHRDVLQSYHRPISRLCIEPDSACALSRDLWSKCYGIDG